MARAQPIKESLRAHTLSSLFLSHFQTYGVIWLACFLFAMSNIVVSTGLFDVA